MKKITKNEVNDKFRLLSKNWRINNNILFAKFAFKSFDKIKKSKIFLDPNLILANAAMKKYRK